jgi:hypothetical protein
MKHGKGLSWNNALRALFVLLLLTDLSISFVQHYHMPLDGDMAVSILPSPEHQPVFDDPLGLDAFLNHKKYAHPNRFVLMASRSYYFKTMPLFLQNFMSPITSVYAACALIKTLFQLLIILLLARYVQLALKLSFLGFLGTAVLLSPLFQTLGYYGSMGVIDWSITYAFSYASSAVLLLAYFLPFYKAWVQNNTLHISRWQRLLFIPAILIMPLSGSLINGCVLIVCLLIFIDFVIDTVFRTSESGIISRVFAGIQKIPKAYFFYLLPLALVCLYSIYIGRYDLENLTHTLPIRERYERLPIGLQKIFTRNPGLPVLSGLIIINLLVIIISKAKDSRIIFNLIKWALLFSVFYLLLIPMGGFRIYRKFIVRYDAFLPVTLSLFYMYLITSIYLIKQLKPTYRSLYLALPIAATIFYFTVDKTDFQRDACQRASLEIIATSKENPVVLNTPCNVLSWNKRTNATANGYNSQLLEMWGITDGYKGYHHKE